MENEGKITTSHERSDRHEPFAYTLHIHISGDLANVVSGVLERDGLLSKWRRELRDRMDQEVSRRLARDD